MSFCRLKENLESEAMNNIRPTISIRILIWPDVLPVLSYLQISGQHMQSLPTYKSGLVVKILISIIEWSDMKSQNALGFHLSIMTHTFFIKSPNWSRNCIIKKLMLVTDWLILYINYLYVWNNWLTFRCIIVREYTDTGIRQQHLPRQRALNSWITIPRYWGWLKKRLREISKTCKGILW